MELTSKNYKDFEIWYDWIVKKTYLNYIYRDIFVQMAYNFMVYHRKRYINFKTLHFYSI